MTPATWSRARLLAVAAVIIGAGLTARPAPAAPLGPRLGPPVEQAQLSTPAGKIENRYRGAGDIAQNGQKKGKGLNPGHKKKSATGG